jgi:hypothetical protein
LTCSQAPAWEHSTSSFYYLRSQAEPGNEMFYARILNPDF